MQCTVINTCDEQETVIFISPSGVATPRPTRAHGQVKSVHVQENVLIKSPNAYQKGQLARNEPTTTLSAASSDWMRVSSRQTRSSWVSATMFDLNWFA